MNEWSYFTESDVSKNFAQNEATEEKYSHIDVVQQLNLPVYVALLAKFSIRLKQEMAYFEQQKQSIQDIALKNAINRINFNVLCLGLPETAPFELDTPSEGWIVGLSCNNFTKSFCIEFIKCDTTIYI